MQAIERTNKKTLRARDLLTRPDHKQKAPRRALRSRFRGSRAQRAAPAAAKMFAGSFRAVQGPGAPGGVEPGPWRGDGGGRVVFGGETKHQPHVIVISGSQPLVFGGNKNETGRVSSRSFSRMGLKNVWKENQKEKKSLSTKHEHVSVSCKGFNFWCPFRDRIP